jgi:Holliday junction resolvase RusA-like endonuclease
MQIYKIPGEPVPLMRSRANHTARRFYNSQQGVMLNASIYLQSQHDDAKFFEGPVHMDVVFYFPYPKAFPKSKRNTVSYKPTRCDLDNLIKFICDVSQGVLFADDAIIASISAKKVYDEDPRTEFTIQSLK